MTIEQNNELLFLRIILSKEDIGMSFVEMQTEIPKQIGSLEFNRVSEKFTQNNYFNDFPYPEKERKILQRINIRQVLSDAGKNHYSFLKSLSDAEEKEKEFREQLIDVNKSTIAANRSTEKMNNEILPKNFLLQEKLTKASILVAIFSGLFILASIFVSIYLNSTTEWKETNKILVRQSQLLDSIKQNQKKIDSSLKELKKDTFLVK